MLEACFSEKTTGGINTISGGTPEIKPAPPDTLIFLISHSCLLYPSLHFQGLYTGSRVYDAPYRRYEIASPALAYPATVFTRVRPEAVAVKTNSSRVWLVTGMERPVTVPKDKVPIARIPVSAGAKVTTAPGTAVKVLLGVAEL